MKAKFIRVFIMLSLFAGIHKAAAQVIQVFPIVTNPAVVAYGTGIAFDGTNYLIEALAGTNTSECTNVNVQLVSSTGSLIGLPIFIGGGATLQTLPLLVFGKTNYLVVWSDNTVSSGVDMFGQFVSITGALVGSQFNLLQSQGASGFQTVKAVAFDGTNFLVVWQDGNTDDYYGQLVSQSGTILVSKIQISTQPNNGESAAVTFGSTDYFVVWQSSNQAYGEFVGRNGSAASPFQIGQTATTDQNPVGGLAVAFDGTNYLAAWNWNPGPETGESVTNWQIYGRLVSQAGTFPGSELMLPGGANQLIPSMAFDGQDYLLTYGLDSNTTNSDRNLRCQFLDRSANLVGPLFTPLTVQGTNHPLFAVNGILFNGNVFVMAATIGTLGINGEILAAAIPASITTPTLVLNGQLSGTQFPLQLNGTPSIKYAIQFRTNLILNNWTAVITNTATNGIFNFTDTHATNASRFYRAVEQ